jgi:hypothetical protein
MDSPEIKTLMNFDHFRFCLSGGAGQTGSSDFGIENAIGC